MTPEQRFCYEIIVARHSGMANMSLSPWATTKCVHFHNRILRRVFSSVQ